VLASATFDEDGPAKRPSVQVGDPFMEKGAHRVLPGDLRGRSGRGIQDLGAAGLTCSTTELAAAAPAA